MFNVYILPFLHSPSTFSTFFPSPRSYFPYLSNTSGHVDKIGTWQGFQSLIDFVPPATSPTTQEAYLKYYTTRTLSLTRNYIKTQTITPKTIRSTLPGILSACIALKHFHKSRP